MRQNGKSLLKGLKVFESGPCSIGCQQWQDIANNSTAERRQRNLPRTAICEGAPRKRFSDAMRTLRFWCSVQMHKMHTVFVVGLKLKAYPITVEG